MRVARQSHGHGALWKSRIQGVRQIERAASDFEQQCQQHMNRFFAEWPNVNLQEKANKVLRMLRASPKPLSGKAAG